MTEKKSYSPEEIDDLCIAFDNSRIAVEFAQQDYSNAKGNLLAAVRAQGHIAPRADKTTRLEGLMYIADSTVGSTVEIDESAVAELNSELSRLKKPSVFRLLFKRTTKHQLLKDAGDTLRLKIGALAEDVQSRLLGIFARCFDVNSKAPTLSVSLATSLREKEAAALAKATKKAAKARKGGAQK